MTATLFRRLTRLLQSAAASDSKFGTAALPAPPAPPGPAGGLWDGRLARGGAGEEHGGVSRGSGGSYLQGTCSLDVCVCVCVHVCVCEACTLLHQDESGRSRGQVSFSLRPVPP